MTKKLKAQMNQHDPQAIKGFIELRIVAITDVRVEFVDKGVNVGVYYENEPATKVCTVRPVFKCKLHDSHAEALNK